MKESYPINENISTAYECVGDRLLSLDLPPNVYEAAASLEISQEIHFDWEGKIDESFESSLTEQLKTVGINESSIISTLTKAILGVVSRYVKEQQKEEALVYVRVTTPNDDFNIARWHRDGFFFNPDEEKKLVFSLKGPVSLIGKAISLANFNEEENSLNRLLNDKDLSDPEVMAARERMAQNVTPLPPPALGQGVVFSVGSESATIHSEPPLNEARIFVSVVAK
jgi:hypothetical protein